MKRVVLSGVCKCGYRAFDTARDYGNEHVVGKVIESA